MDQVNARALVEATIAEIPAAEPLAIDDARTVVTDDWWVFRYDTLAAIESGDVSDSLVGAAPIVVDRRTGDVLLAPSWKPFDEFLAELQPGGPNLAW